jgi:hypothetical protein
VVFRLFGGLYQVQTNFDFAFSNFFLYTVKRMCEYQFIEPVHWFGTGRKDETMKTKISITHNGFHGYTTRSLTVIGNPGDRVELSPAQIKKLSRAACGMSDCRCGESMLAACEQPEPWNPEAPVYLTIPETGTEIEVSGNYPRR